MDCRFEEGPESLAQTPAFHLLTHESVPADQKTEVHDHPELLSLFEQIADLFRESVPHGVAVIPGGGSYNTCEALWACGVSAYPVAEISDDRWGQLAHGLIAQHPAAPQYVRRRDGSWTTVSFWHKGTGLVNRKIGLAANAPPPPPLDFSAVQENPDMLMVAASMSDLPTNLKNMRARWEDSAIVLLGSSATKGWTRAFLRQILPQIHVLRMNRIELLDLLKTNDLIPLSAHADTDLSRIIQGAQDLAALLPAGGLLVATGGAGQTLMVAQNGAWGLLPPPPVIENPHTRGAGDTSNAWFYTLGHRKGMDFRNLGNRLEDALELECAVSLAMLDFVRGHPIEPQQGNFYLERAPEMVKRVRVS